MKSFKRLFTPRAALVSAKLRRQRATTARKLRAAQQHQRESLGQRTLIPCGNAKSRFHYHK